jgi:hypothetical protein
MPVIYDIDKTINLIRTRCVGSVTLNEIADHFRILEQDPDCPDQLDVLLDLSAQKSLPERVELMAVSHEIGRIRGKVRFIACAIVVPSDVYFGMIRMFEVFVEKQFTVTQVFRTVPEAETWLSLRRAASDKKADS